MKNYVLRCVGAAKHHQHPVAEIPGTLQYIKNEKLEDISLDRRINRRCAVGSQRYTYLDTSEN